MLVSAYNRVKNFIEHLKVKTDQRHKIFTELFFLNFPSIVLSRILYLLTAR
jgi:hypothetical protein